MIHNPLLVSRPSNAARVLALLTILASPAAAVAGEDPPPENECRRSPSLSVGPALTFGRISAAGRTAFVKDGGDRHGCPDPSPECRGRGYLVSGDPVILGERRGAYLCANYRGAKDDLGRTGWIPAAAVTVEAPAPVTPEKWLGIWTQAEGKIEVKPGERPGTLAFAGDATWGAGDPGRTKRGSVHVGEFSGTVAPAGDTASFAVGESGPIPVEQGDKVDCKIWLRRMGPWLVVDDNLYCGGMNVSFRGVYRRRP